MTETIEHPALKKFSKPWEYTKHLAGSALKGAAKGAIIGGIALVGLGALAAMTGPIGWVAAAVLTKVGVTGSIITSGLLGGGLIGGFFGLMKGVANAPEKVQEAEDRRIANYERTDAFLEQAAMRQAQRMPQQGMIQAPDVPDLSESRGRTL